MFNMELSYEVNSIIFFFTMLAEKNKTYLGSQKTKTKISIPAGDLINPCQ